MSFARYPEYKDSGVEWLGEVPGHWEVVRLNTTATCNDEVLLESTAEDYEIEYVEISGVQAGQGITETATLPFGNAPSRARRVVRDGDVLISTVRTYLRAIAQVKSPPENMIASTGFAVLRPRRIDSRFLGYACHAEGFVSEVIARSVGVSYPAINASELARLPIPLPTAPEQTAIATFLDRETAKIDALVAEQQELIALLQEKRQAVISHAVTKGLNPSVPMKDSGVEWLGEVPAHWAISLLKRAFSSVDYGISESLDSDGNIAILRMGNIVDGHLDLSDLKYVNAVDPALLLRAGDLLYNRTNSVDLVGKVGLVTAEVGEATSFASYLVRLRVRSGACAKYFAQLLNHPGFLGLVRSSAFVAIGQCNLNPNRYGEFIVPIPPAAEQDAIANFLESRVYEFDRLVIEAKAAVNLLRERRTALISAAVTGQIDVRGLVGGANAPDSVAASAYPASA